MTLLRFAPVMCLAAVLLVGTHAEAARGRGFGHGHGFGRIHHSVGMHRGFGRAGGAHRGFARLGGRRGGFGRFGNRGFGREGGDFDDRFRVRFGGLGFGGEFLD